MCPDEYPGYLRGAGAGMKRLRRVRPAMRSRGSRAILSLASLGKSVRQNFLTLLASGILVVALVALGISVHSFIFSSEYFLVRDIEVVDKNPQKIDHSLARLRQAPGNIFSLDLHGIQRRLEQSYPEIQTVRVSRVMPNKLVLEVIHRRPIAQIELVSQAGPRVYYSVNEEGYVLALCGSEPRPNLPVITGVNMRPQEVEIGRCYERSPIETALALRRQLLARGIWQKYTVTRIDVTHPRSIVFVIDNRVEVRLGAVDADARLDQLTGILQSAALDRTQSTCVDLRFKEVIIGKPSTL